MRKRIVFGVLSAVLFGVEVLIGMYAHGWVRNYFGDVLIVILLYTLFRTAFPEWPRKWWVLPTAILAFAFAVEFMQLWGFGDHFGITNRLLLIILGTGYSTIDLMCYAIGIVPCYVAEYMMFGRKMIL
ncbi:MAG: DUF2809 domain-containing protein [Lachnospiraceae bacterium]|nr:DUF2809 domain-containing protein [Lachnospiraceae bacterium]